MVESEIKEEIMVDQTSDFKHETSDFLKQEICSCADVKKFKTELFDPDCKDNIVKEEFCDHHINPVYSKANENQSENNMICEIAADTDVSLFSTSTSQQNSEPKNADLSKQVNSDERPYSCSQCTYSCKVKGTLKRHMKHVHSNERPYSCSQCSYSCKVKGTLTQHIKHVHSNERPFSCPQCQYSCIAKSILTKHVKQTHSNERPYICSQCSYSSKAKCTLTQHMKNVHSDEKPFSCSQSQ